MKTNLVDLDKSDFCCQFGIDSSGNVICELFLGSNIVDQPNPPDYDPSVAVAFEEANALVGWWEINYAGLPYAKEPTSAPGSSYGSATAWLSE